MRVVVSVEAPGAVRASRLGACVERVRCTVFDECAWIDGRLSDNNVARDTAQGGGPAQ